MGIIHKGTQMEIIYELHLNEREWTCGDGCCYESWYEPEIFKVDPYGKKETLMDAGEWYGVSTLIKEEDTIFELINSYHNLDIVLDSHNCKIVF